MSNCRQACPHNTLYGCKVKEHNGTCPLSNSATPITEYRMTNADRIRAMTDRELVEIIMCPYDSDIEICSTKGTCLDCCMEWLKQPAEVDHDL